MTKIIHIFGCILLGVLLCMPCARAQDGDDDHDHDHDPIHEIIEMFDEDNDTMLSEEEFFELYEALFGEQDDHDHDHARRLQQRLRIRFVAAASSLWVANKQHLPHNNKRDHGEECHPAEELFEEYDIDANTFLNETEVEGVVPALLLMILHECAVSHASHDDDHSDCEEPEDWEAWLSALASVLIVTLITLVGIAIIPFTTRWPTVTRYVMSTMIAFAAGALIGDAIYHLIPIAVELHAHDEEEGDHGDEEEGHEDEHDEDKDYLGPLTLVLVGMLFFFLIETFLYWFLGRAHSHGELDVTAADQGDDVELDKQDDEERNADGATSSEDEGSSDGSQVPVGPKKKGFKGSMVRLKDGAMDQAKRLRFVKGFGWLNLCADLLHNFVDGIAIGVAYTTSLTLGLSTTIAVGLHEIPQELGDYAILVGAGFGKPLALLFNLLTGCTAILGAIIGVGVGKSASDADKWILAFTAGGFLYIALADMIPELHKATRVKNWWGLLDIGLQVFAMLVGFAILVILAVYEEDITDC